MGIDENIKFHLIFPNLRLYEPFSVTPHQPSLSLGYLAGILSENNIKFQITDATVEKLNHSQLINLLKISNPIYVGLTVNISLVYAAITHSLFIKLKLPHLKVVMGGPWATAQDKFLIEKGFADIVVLGEGEYTILELAKVDPNNEIALKSIKGISFSTKAGYYTTGIKENIKNLDNLPLPKWEYFPKNGYYKSSRKKPIYPLLTSRGCPFNCLNCTKIIHGYKLRYRSIENILKELDYLKEIGCKEIIIEDDMFNFDLKRMKHLFREIIKRNYGFKFQLSNGIRADRMDKEFADLLYAAGTYRAALAIESGSQKVIEFLNKELDLKLVPKAVNYLKKANIKVSGYFILGLPIENINSLFHTVNYANELKLDIVVLLNLLVFPGSRMEKYVLKNKNINISDSYEINKISNYVYTPIPFSTPNLTPNIIKKVQNYNLIKSFLNPIRFFNILSCYSPREFIFQITKQIRTIIMKILIKLKIY